MKKIIDIDHHSIKSAPDVSDICHDFFQYSNITAFVYARIFDDGSNYGLNSNAQWQLHHFNGGHLVTPPIPKNIINSRCSFILSLKTTPEPFLRTIQDFRNILGMDYPYFAVERYATYYDLYVFCTHVDNEEIINFYLNEQDYLEKFKQYFKNKAKNLINDAKKHKIIIPKSMQPEIDWHSQRQKIHDISPLRYAISYCSHDIEFTAKEAKCLKYLASGYNTKYIARTMGLSPRTIEFHINNIKEKMSVNTITEVLIILDAIKAQVRSW